MTKKQKMILVQEDDRLKKEAENALKKPLVPAPKKEEPQMEKKKSIIQARIFKPRILKKEIKKDPVEMVDKATQTDSSFI